MQTVTQNTENFSGYIKCGEILKSPTQTYQNPFVFKCFECKEVYLLLDSFIFHLEIHCKELSASTNRLTFQGSGSANDAIAHNFNIIDVKDGVREEGSIEEIRVKEEDVSSMEMEDPLVFIKTEYNNEASSVKGHTTFPEDNVAKNSNLKDLINLKSNFIDPTDHEDEMDEAIDDFCLDDNESDEDENSVQSRTMANTILNVESIERPIIGTSIGSMEHLQNIEASQKYMNNKISIILKNQEKMLTLLAQQNSPNTKDALTIFPIKTSEEIEKANHLIGENPDNYISIIREIIFPGTLKENFHRLFDAEFIIDYNYNGVSAKSSLKEYKHLIEAIFEATKKNGYTYKEFINDIRQAIKIVKNRHFKKQYDLKKKKQTS